MGCRIFRCSNTLSNSAGSVGIFTTDPDGKTVAEAQAAKIDVVAWGNVSHVKEGTEANAPGSGKSIERRARSSSTSTSMGPGGVDEFKGNGYDSDDNSNDFVLRETPESQNSSSPQEPGPPATVTVTASLATIPANGVSTSMITATVKDQYGNDVADGTTVTFTTDLGTFAESGNQTYNTTTTGGAATATLRSSTSPGVRATSGLASGQTTVQFTLVRPVGGVIVPVNKLGLMAPWIGLATLASIAACATMAIKRHMT